MKLEIEVKSCFDCPMRNHEYGQGGSYDYCSHKDAPRGYGNVLGRPFTVVPEWCPIKDKDND